MEHKLRQIASAYDILAHDWTTHFSDEHAKKPRDQEMLQMFAIEVGNKIPVWDLGCGSGSTSAHLHALGVQASGLDISEGFISEAKKNYPHIEFRQGNMLDLPFQSEAVAGLVSFYAIVHFTADEVQRAFGEVFRVLQPDGVFLCTYHVGCETVHIDEFLGHKVNLDFQYFTTDFISDCLKKSGFEQIAIVERAPYPEIEHPSRRAYAFARKVR